MKNPLNKRLLRELRSDVGKYIVIFILLVLSIGFVSGFLVAGDSMITAYNESFDKYNVENGNFRTEDKLTDTEKDWIEKENVTVYENFYVEKNFDNETKLRIFANREEIDKVCVMEGRLPKKPQEIAIDRMYADNNDLKVGDSLVSEGKNYSIVGLVALSDYSALFYSNNDMMFDSSAFGVAIVSKDQFNTYNEDDVEYNYGWIYDVRPTTEEKEKEASDDLMEHMAKKVTLENFIPRYLDQAITFTGEDLGSDKAMMEVLLYIIIIIVAFVFGITINNTIHKEATVIGTLRASGYTINELIRHYMAMPLVVTIIASIIGNILGYTFFKDVCAAMYYGSYSLPTYVTLWNAEAFIRTTIIPMVIMLVITYFILRKKLALSPLKLIKRDLSGKKQKTAVRLNKKIRFFDRFRIRILIQNKSSYIILFTGLLFANMLLFFGMMLPPLLVHYQGIVTESMLAKHIYLLQMPAGAIDSNDELSAAFSYTFLQSKITTNNPDAEKFSAYSLKTTGEGGTRVEEVTLYGIQEDSRYIDAKFDEKMVLISSAYADKYGLGKGDVITLKEPYEDRYYGFKVSGIYDYDGGITVFMSKKHLNDVLGYDEEFFSGYFSDSEITDIEGKYIGTTVDEESLTRVSRQLMISMGNLMYMVDGFSVIMFIVLIYILSKLIIERNVQSISMAKILGYSKKEIATLYIIPTALVVVASLLISYPILSYVMVGIFRVMLKKMMSGWMVIWLDPSAYVKMFLMGIITYAVVAIIEYRKIGKIPMNEALKNVE
ncbi:putative ABC transport system permease protein [Butyrivibrio hungatei DSM 14810]|uniref:Putative ABC transport system permease protein n=1 Tax=Butyrivibrio hungatei DSM 14810 TaxID=1121132 RepID=A0A1M7RQW3_9FIRM|nr:ABC transporter permease [Butyrivibrio hungatei]SHN48570.1 putative ABC transport system permease protein [Butyrivibrio hungatei DSM 14810]